MRLGRATERGFDVEKIARKAYDERSTFAHGSDLKKKLTQVERDQFCVWTTEIARKLFLGAGSWESLEQLRSQLDDVSVESIDALKSLDDYAHVIWTDEGEQAS